MCDDDDGAAASCAAAMERKGMGREKKVRVGKGVWAERLRKKYGGQGEEGQARLEVKGRKAGGIDERA